MKIAIIGAGNMGGAIARGLARGNKIAPSHIFVSNRGNEKLEALKVEFPELNVTTDNVEAAKEADVVLLAVKPWLVNARFLVGYKKKLLSELLWRYIELNSTNTFIIS